MGKEALEKVKAIRQARDKAARSSVIQVWQSDLYDFNPGVGATLVAIAFLQMSEETSNYPEDAPKEFRDDRIGWCWMSQRGLAERVGKSESQVHRDIKRFERDGVLKVRSWKDDNKTDHHEYHVDEDAVAKHQRVKDAPRPARNKRDYKEYDNRGAFKKGNQAAKSEKAPPASHALGGSISRICPPASHAFAPPASHAYPNASDAVVGGCSRSFGSSSSPQDVAQPVLRAARDENPQCLVEDEDTPKPGRGLGAEQTKPARATGHVTKGEKKPLPNYLCYPEALKAWRLARHLQKCRRCGDVLQRNETHVCEGFVPKCPEKPRKLV